MLAVRLLGLLALVTFATAAPYQAPTDYAAAISSLQTLPAQREPELDPSAWHRRELERYRREEIARQILSYLKLPCLPQPPQISQNSRQLLSQLTGLVQNSTSPGHRDRLRRAQSLPPSCDWPKTGPGSDLWQSVPSLRIFFNLTTYFPSVPEHATIEAAELHIYKKTGAQLSRPAPVAPVQLTARVSVYVYPAPAPSGGAANATWRVASAEVPVSLVDWVRLDVRNAVVAWQQGMPNLGLLLTVEDTAGRRVDPRLYFQDLSCDAEIPSSPMPGLLMEAAEQQHVPLLAGGLYPLLDLRTSEPTSDATIPGEDAGPPPTTAPCVYPGSGAAAPGAAPEPSAPTYNALAPFVRRQMTAGMGRMWRRRRQRRDALHDDLRSVLTQPDRWH